MAKKQSKSNIKQEINEKIVLPANFAKSITLLSVEKPKNKVKNEEKLYKFAKLNENLLIAYIIEEIMGKPLSQKDVISISLYGKPALFKILSFDIIESSDR